MTPPSEGGRRRSAGKGKAGTAKPGAAKAGAAKAGAAKAGGSGRAGRGGGANTPRASARSGAQPPAKAGAGQPGRTSRGAPPRRQDVRQDGRERSRERDSSPLAPPDDRRRSRSKGSELGGEQVEGRHAVRELLAARRRPVRQIWMAEGVDPAPILDDIAELAAAASVPVRIVNSARLRQASSTDAPQGVLAFADELPESELDDLATSQPGRQAPFLVVVDGVTDPHNLGALLRSAQCAGATGAVLPRHRSAHITATVAKAAAGAIEYLPVAVVPGIASALARLTAAGVWTVGLDAGAADPLWSLSVATEPIAIVVGAEGSGLSRLVKARCQLLVAIPQAGPIASLNVAAAGALACFEVSRARGKVLSDG